MFEAVCIRRQQPLFAPEPLDLSFLAEALLFYQSVHLIADMDILKQLVSELGPALVNELLEEGFLKISYLEKRTAISNYNVGTTNELHLPVTLTSANNDWRLEKIAPEIFSKVAGGPGYGRRLGRRFAEIVPTIDIGDELLTSVKSDFVDEVYIENAVAKLLEVIAPTYRLPQDYHYKVYTDSGKFRIETNIDFQQANEKYNQSWHLTGDTLSPSSLLVYMLEARSDLYFASKESAELATHPGNAAIIDTKWREILKNRSQSEHNIEAFQELILNNGHEIGESIKSGYRTWRDLHALLKDKNVHKFKNWLQQIEGDTSLIHEYYNTLEKETWIGTLPPKVFRFLILTAAGFIFSPLVAIGLSGADTFLLDRYASGWRPNQFVNGPLKGFARLD